MASKSVTQAYSMLADKCNAMLDSKFIMSNNAIASILKLIASVPYLTNYLVKCSQGFNFELALSNATTTSKLILPAAGKDKVAFITQLLYRFDRKEIDLTKFIKVYFPSNDFENSYKLFCQNIITPYLLAYNGIIKEEENSQDVVPDDNLPVIEAVKTQVTQYITSLVDKVTNDESLKEQKRDDYLLMLEGFYYAFELNGAKMVKVVWTGLKNIMSTYKPAVSALATIEKILLQYAVI